MLRRILSTAAISTALIAISTFGASAAIVCQRDVCWHTHEQRMTFPYMKRASLRS